MKPTAIVLTGAGLNCERESAAALKHAGFDARIIHIIDLLDAPEILAQSQLLLLPGGFSYGDHAGAAFVMAEQLRRIDELMLEFVTSDKLMIGICNGCQVLLRLGLFAQSDWGFRANQGDHYECRWAHLRAACDSAFFRTGDVMPVPVAHGEGRLFGGDASQIALQYCNEFGELAENNYPLNPNGADKDCAAVCAHQGRVLAMMPHPERGFFNWQRPDWTGLLDAAKRSGVDFDPGGMTPAAAIFTNAKSYFE